MTSAPGPTPARAGRGRRVGSRLRRGVSVLLVVVLVLALSVGAVVALRISGEVAALLRVPPTVWPSQVRIVAVGDDRVTIEEVEDGPWWLTVGRTYGLEWESGSGRVGRVLADDGARVERSFRVLEGSPPRPGTLARYSREAFPRDARRAFPDADVQELSVPGPGDGLPAWFVPGTSRTWAILVHGRGSARSEMFRLMRSTVDLGMPSLAVTYRGAPEAGGGQARVGLTEWRDLESAVRLARQRGARDVVLLGVSMGGSVVAAFLERSELADRVRAVVLDAPLLDFEATLHQVKETDGVPGFLVTVGLWVAELRTGLDFDEVDHLDELSWLTAPVLLLHGAADASVPVATSRRLHDLAPDRVTLRVFEGAGHVESWNSAPGRYDRVVRGFLRRHR